MDERSVLLIIIGASVAGIAIVVVLVLVIWCVLLKEPKDDESEFLQRLRTKLKGRGPDKRLMDLELQDMAQTNTLQGEAKPQPLPAHDELTSQCYRLRLAKSNNCYLLNDQGVATVGPRGWYPPGFELWRLVPVWEFMSPTTRSYRIVSVAHSGMTGLASLDHFAVQVSSSVADPVAHQWILLPEQEGTRFLLENVLTASALCVKEKQGAHLSYIDHQDFDQYWLLEAEHCGTEPCTRFELHPDTPYYVQTMEQALTSERYPKLTALAPEKSKGQDVWFIRKVDPVCLEKQCLSCWEEVYHVGMWHPEHGELFITATEHRAVELKSPAGNSISALLSRQSVEWSQCWSLRRCAGGGVAGVAGVALRSLLHPSMSLANCGGTIRLETNRPCPAQLFVFQEVL